MNYELLNLLILIANYFGFQNEVDDHPTHYTLNIYINKDEEDEKL